MILLPNAINKLVYALKAHGGHSLLVGGCVRDHLRGVHPTDIDMEIYNLSMSDIKATLDSHGIAYDTVGASFGVLKLRDYNIDISIPRRENRVGVKHTDFDIELDPTMVPQEAARRRDFTINSMAFDTYNGHLIDPFNGRSDLERCILRATDPVTFVEDPLRVLRAMQFISRFNFTPHASLVSLCSTLSVSNLSKERVFEEWKKMLLKGEYIDKGLQFLRDCSWDIYFPELRALQHIHQEPDWHPEGDAWTHTLCCMQVFGSTKIVTETGINDDYERLVVGFGTLLHDVGKPGTTELCENGKIRALSHR